MAASQGHSWIDETISHGRYRITAVMGEGGMGRVYRAFRTLDDEPVVVKVPHPELLRDPEFAGRFEREVKSLHQLNHNHIVPVYDWGRHQGVPFAVLKFLGGGSLSDMHDMSEVPQQRLAQLGYWLPEIAAALDYVHSHGLIHRDVKPGNILFDEKGRAWLGDFGIVKSVYESPDLNVRKLTQTGTVIGTPEYMAPELSLGERYDHRADIFSLAVTAFEFLTGEPPWTGPTPAAVLLRQNTTATPRLHELTDWVPEALSQAIERGMAHEAANRYPSCLKFARAVTQALQQKAVPVDVPDDELPVFESAGSVNDSLTSIEIPVMGDTARHFGGDTGRGEVRRLRCPECGKRLKVLPRHAGMQTHCPRCELAITVSMYGDRLLRTGMEDHLVNVPLESSAIDMDHFNGPEDSHSVEHDDHDQQPSIDPDDDDGTVTNTAATDDPGSAALERSTPTTPPLAAVPTDLTWVSDDDTEPGVRLAFRQLVRAIWRSVGPKPDSGMDGRSFALTLLLTTSIVTLVLYVANLAGWIRISLPDNTNPPHELPQRAE